MMIAIPHLDGTVISQFKRRFPSRYVSVLKDGKAICGGLSWTQTIGHLQIYIDLQTNLKPEEMDLL